MYVLIYVSAVCTVYTVYMYMYIVVIDFVRNVTAMPSD